MKIDNPLSHEFLVNYPTEAARVLEEISAQHVAALFTELPPQTATHVMTAMLPEMAAACLAVMTAGSAAKLVNELPAFSAARIYNLLAPAKQDELFANFSEKTRSRIRRYQMYPADSVGALLDPGINILPQNVTVAEAMRRIERLDHSVGCEIYIVDDAHHLVGLIELGKLMTSRHQARLQDIMSRKTQRIPAHKTAETLLSHPGWKTRRSLPVVERDNTLVGVLDYNYLQESVGEVEASGARDPLEDLLSLAGLYWLSLAQLLDSVLNTASPDKGEGQ